MKFKNTDVWGFEHALRGMRNPKDSWDQSDSEWKYPCSENKEYCDNCGYDACNPAWHAGKYVIGPKDMKLAQGLIKGGPEHRKFLRQIFVSVDITAPLYW